MPWCIKSNLLSFAEEEGAATALVVVEAFLDTLTQLADSGNAAERQAVAFLLKPLNDVAETLLAAKAMTPAQVALIKKEGMH